MAADPLTPAKELCKQATERRALQSNRIATYERYLAQYFQDRSGQSADGAALKNYSDGRPALRAHGETASGKEHRASPNYIKPIVKDLVSIRGIWPVSTVSPASGKDQDREQAVLLTRALRQQHEHSAMVRQQQRGGFFLSCLGDCCYTLDPRTPKMDKERPNPFRPVGIYYNVINPGQAFPEFSSSGDEDLEDLFWIAMMPRGKARREYPMVRLPLAEDESQEEVEIIHYYSRTERQTLVDGQRAFGINHNLGFCPAEWVSNEATDGRWAQADIAGTMDLHEEIQDLWKVYVDSLVGSVYPIYHIHDQHLTQGVLEYGPGAQFTTTGTAKLEVLAPQANAQAAGLIFENAVDNLMKQTGIAPVRLEGQIDRSNVSARSVDRQQAPMEQRMKLSLDLVGEGLQRLNSKCLLMLGNIAELKDAEMELYGQDREGTYHETFTGADIGGWVRNTVKWGSMTGQTKQEALMGNVQLYKEGQGVLFPFENVILAAGYDDPKEIMDRGEAEHKRIAAAQAPPSGPPGTPPPGGPPPGGAPGGPASAMQDAMSLAGGGAGGGGPGPVQPPPGGSAAPPNGAPPPGMPNFAPMASAPGGPKGSPAPVPDIEGMVQDALSKAGVADVATLAVRGKALVVEVTDATKARQVHEALRPVEEQIGVRIAVKVISASRGK